MCAESETRVLCKNNQALLTSGSSPPAQSVRVCTLGEDIGGSLSVSTHHLRQCLEPSRLESPGHIPVSILWELEL